SLSFYLVSILLIYIYFLFTDPPTTQNYTLSLHDALPILNKLYLLMEKQHNRGQDGAGIAAVKLNVEPGYPFMHRIRSNAPQAIVDIFSKINSEVTELVKYHPPLMSQPGYLKGHVSFLGEVLLGTLR